jgi:hypothetical protein
VAKIITVAEFGIDDVGAFVGNFTQLKIALAYINLTDCFINGRPATYDRISVALRKQDGHVVLEDSEGFRVFALCRNELNPTKETKNDD